MPASYAAPTHRSGRRGGPDGPTGPGVPAPITVAGVAEGTEGRPSTSWVLNRRQLLGGGLLGAAGLAVVPLGTGSPTDGSAQAGAADADPAPDRAGPPASLRVDGLVAPLGLAVDDVYFSWQL